MKETEEKAKEMGKNIYAKATKGAVTGAITTGTTATAIGGPVIGAAGAIGGVAAGSVIGMTVGTATEFNKLFSEVEKRASTEEERKTCRRIRNMTTVVEWGMNIYNATSSSSNAIKNISKSDDCLIM